MNELAFNIPMGRNFAGIHYRTNASGGLKLDEAVAITLLQDHVATVTEDFAGFEFTKCDGTPVVITEGGRFRRSLTAVSGVEGCTSETSTARRVSSRSGHHFSSARSDAPS